MITIIIPAYNVEQYIDECIQSVLNQDNKDFECIIIDDGSTDKTGEKCDNWSSKDPRIRVFHQKNMGVSVARNVGLEKAHGQYVTFIDSDDLVSKTYLSDMAKYIDGKQELIVSGFILYPIKSTYKSQEPDEECEINICPANVKKIVSLNEKCLLFGPYAKIYNMNIIRDFGIVFDPNMSFGEDLYFNYKYLEHIHKIRAVSKTNYYYRETGANSLSNIFRKDKFDITYKEWHIIKNFYVSRKIWDNDVQKYLYKLLWMFIYDGIFAFPYIPNHTYDYLKKILGVKELDELKYNLNLYDCALWIKLAIVYRKSWIFYLYFKSKSL